MEHFLREGEVLCGGGYTCWSFRSRLELRWTAESSDCRSGPSAVRKCGRELKDGQRSRDEHETIGSFWAGKEGRESVEKGSLPRRAGLPRQEFFMKHMFHR